MFLNVSENKLSGSVDLCSFSREWLDTRIFCAAANTLSGSLNFTSIPMTLEAIDLSRNSFSGNVLFGQNMPNVLFLQSNKLTGLELKYPLGDNVVEISLLNNAITVDSIRIGTLPEKMQYFDLRGNEVGQCLNADGYVHSDARMQYKQSEKQSLRSFQHWGKIA